MPRLEDGFEQLAQTPALGRSCDSIRAGLRRFEVGSHVLFYLVEDETVRVLRVLHERMLPSRARFDEKEDRR